MKKIVQSKYPIVSVIMPVHNAGKFFVPAIESILTQTYKRFELIIVDDGSTDDSWKTIRSYRTLYPKTVHVYRTAKQLNAAGNGATDIGLTHAKGEFIARMDADDVARPKRIEKQVEFLLANPLVILVGTQADIIDKNGAIIGSKSVPTNHEAIYNQYGFVHPVIHPSVMIRRSMLPNPDKLYLQKWGINDDYYTFFKLLNYGQFANLPEKLLKYRVHGGNASLTNIKEKCYTTAQIRIEAMKYFNYHMSIWALGIMMLQVAFVSVIPNRTLEWAYPMLRGMNRQPIKQVRTAFTRLVKLALATPYMRKYASVAK